MLKKVREKKFTAFAVATTMMLGVTAPLSNVMASENPSNSLEENSELMDNIKSESSREEISEDKVNNTNNETNLENEEKAVETETDEEKESEKDSEVKVDVTENKENDEPVAEENKETESKGKEVEIPILTFNDFHGSLKNSGKDVGASKLVGEVKRVKSEKPNTIVVTGGDIYQGSAMSNLLKGKPVSDMLKEMGVDFSAVGNHEFDWGYEYIPDWAKAGEFEFLASNIYEKETGKPVEWAKPYGIVEREGKKVGFIGLATPETAYKTNPANVAHLEFKDPKEATKTWVSYLENEEKVDAVVVLSHLGSEQNRETGEITGEIVDVANVEGVDAIISAHSHQRVEGVVNGVPVIQAYKNGRNLGYVNLKFDEKGDLEVTTKLDDISARKDSLIEDENMKNILAKYEEELGPIMKEKIADLEVNLDHNRDKGLSPMGATVAEAMRKIAKVDIAITNGGGVRAPLQAGTITVGDLYTILPFDNTLFTMEMKGKDIIKVLEHGIEPDNFGWGQHAGVKVWYTPGAERGKKITSVRLADGTKLEEDKYYTVVTNDFMAVGGDSYDFSAAKNKKDTNLVIRDEIANLWKNEGIKAITDLESLIIAGKDETLEPSKPVEPENPVEPSNPENPVKPIEPSKPSDKLPQTGMPFGGGIVAVFGTILSIGGTLVLKKKKNDDVA